MIPRLLLFFSALSLISGEVTLDQLRWQPNLITKESILADYKNITKYFLPVQFYEIPKLVFIIDGSEHGYHLAEEKGEGIDFVSFVWFTVVPKFSDYGKLIGVAIMGKEKIKQNFIRKLRHFYPNIKIVPRFEFKPEDFPPDIVKAFVKTEWFAHRAGQTIVNFCHEHGFDGAVIKCADTMEKGIVSEGRFVDSYMVNLYRDMVEALEDVGHAIRQKKLFAIFSMQSPITLLNMEHDLKKEMHISISLSPEFNRQIMNAYDFVHIYYPERTELINRQYIHDRYLEKIMKFYDYSPKLLLGINYYGHEFPLDDYLKGGNGKKWKAIDRDRYLEVLKKDDAVLTFNEVNKEHELTSESANAFIIFPSLTQLEYVFARIKQHPGVGIGIWEYGMGLDYFTCLV